MNQQQTNNSKAPDQVVNWPLIFCRYAALPLELLLHNLTSFGIRSVGPRAGGAVLLMFLFVAFHSQDNCLPLMGFLIAVIPLSLVAHISAVVRKRRGEQIHTRYNGRPYAMRLLPQWNEITIKRLEPFVVLAIGWGIHHFNHPLGAFLMTGAIGMGVSVGIEYGVKRKRALDINDQIIEQKIAVESIRKLQHR